MLPARPRELGMRDVLVGFIGEFAREFVAGLTGWGKGVLEVDGGESKG